MKLTFNGRYTNRNIDLSIGMRSFGDTQAKMVEQSADIVTATTR